MSIHKWWSTVLKSYWQKNQWIICTHKPVVHNRSIPTSKLTIWLHNVQRSTLLNIFQTYSRQQALVFIGTLFGERLWGISKHKYVCEYVLLPLLLFCSAITGIDHKFSLSYACPFVFPSFPAVPLSPFHPGWEAAPLWAYRVCFWQLRPVCICVSVWKKRKGEKERKTESSEWKSLLC